MGIPKGYHFLRAHQNHGKGALKVCYRASDGFLGRGGVQTLPDDKVGDDFAVVRRLENVSLPLQLVPELRGVDEPAVIGERHVALDMGDDNRLRVCPRVLRVRRIADVAYRRLAAEGGKFFLVEDLGYEPEPLFERYHAAVVHGDAAGLLAAVLKRVERGVGDARGVKPVPGAGTDAENAALLARLIGNYAVTIHESVHLAP